MKVNSKYFQSNWTGGIYGKRNGLKGVVIHDAAAGMSATADSVAAMTANRMKNDTSAANYHYVVDANNWYQLCGEAYATYSLGDKNTTDTFYPNDWFISIEIAPSLTGGNFASDADRKKYYAAWEQACILAGEICKRYNLSSDKIFQHRDYGSTACPYTMSKYFGSYEKALSATRNKVNASMKGTTSKIHYKVIYDLRGSKNKPWNYNHYLVEYTETRDIWESKTGKLDTSKFYKGNRQQVYTKPGARTKNGNKMHFFISGNGKEYYCVSETQNK